MPQPRHPGPLPPAKWPGELRRQLGHVLQMLFKRLPLLNWLALQAMRVVLSLRLQQLHLPLSLSTTVAGGVGQIASYGRISFQKIRYGRFP